MEIRKINDTTIRCIITQKDLEDNHLDLDEILEHRPEAMAYLKNIVLEAAREQKFEINGPFTAMQVRVLQDNSICITLSQCPRPNFLKNLQDVAKQQGTQKPTIVDEENRPLTSSSNQDQGKDKNKEQEQGSRDYVFFFSSMDDVAEGCRQVKNARDYSSDLYANDKEGGYYLVFHHAGDDGQFEKMILAMNEFGTLLELSSEEAAYIAEHEKWIRKEDAAKVLSEI